jgi:tetratricopeptide (TPR) repeat protein
MAKKKKFQRGRIPARQGADGIVSTGVRRQNIAVCVALVLLVAAVFGQTARFGFVNYDDPDYVSANPVVEKGLTLQGVVWAFSYGRIGHWHPLTWLTHMADDQVYGPWAGGHHLTNVALHAIAVVLLFLVLRDMTGKLWRSAFVAVVFAIHPLRAESVAWVAERKDVLSGAFFMLTLWAYVHYTRRPSRRRYVGMAVLYGLGLLSKNTLVTLPFVLLLLDYWPLKRISDFRFPISDLKRLLIEKIPLFLLSAGSCVATFLVPEKIPSGHQLTVWLRIANALTSYVTYMRQMVFPVGLASPYPYPPDDVLVREAAMAFVVLAVISAGVLVSWKKHPYLLVGWLWYLGMLVPAIGIVQISYYAHADRYTYLPEIGLALAGTWAVAEWNAAWKFRRAVLGGGMAVVTGGLIYSGWIQTSHWKTSESLWIHTLACTLDNYIAHNNLGQALFQTGKVDEATAHYQQALQINPNYAEAHNNLGNALFQKRKVDEAIAHYQKALQINPDYFEAHNNLGNTLLQKGSVEEAIAHYQKALQINPDFAEAHNNLGPALIKKGRMAEAMVQFQKALQINPGYADAHDNLGNALLQMGKVDEAIVQFQQVLQIKPDSAEACNNLGSALMQKGQIDEAMVQFQQALQINPGYAEAHNNLGYVLLHKGIIDEAITHFQKALAINPDLAEAHRNLGDALAQIGRVDEGIEHLQKALAIQPDLAEAQSDLAHIAWIMATSPDASIRNGTEAVELARQTDQLSGGKNPIMAATLAAAYAEAGNFSEAVATARRALQLAGDQTNAALAAALQQQIKLYEARLPARDVKP